LRRAIEIQEGSMFDTILRFWQNRPPPDTRRAEPDMLDVPTRAESAEASRPPACAEYAFTSIDVGNYA
jgi:hypothetical protein